MPSQYGFETRDDRARDRDELLAVYDRITMTVQQILADFVDASELPHPFSVRADREGLAWLIEKRGVSASPPVIEVELDFLDDDENREPWLLVAPWQHDLPGYAAKNLKVLPRALQRETKLLAQLQR